MTIRRPFELAGIGLHTGKRSSARFEPAGSGKGIVFSTDQGEIGINGGVTALPARPAGGRRTTLGGIETVEHALSAAYGLGICNLRIGVNGPELPAADGSALPFVRAFKAAGITAQKRPRKTFALREPIFISSGNAVLAAVPDDRFRVTYTLDYGLLSLKGQTVSLEMNPRNYAADIAPARTFCTEEEAAALRKRGFGKGADTRNTLVMGKKGPRGNRLRFPDECARHKVLDLVGDLALLGFALKGHVIGIRSGHALNHRLVEAIIKQREGSHAGIH